MNTRIVPSLFLCLVMLASCGQPLEGSAGTTTLKTDSTQSSASPSPAAEFSVSDLSEPVGCQVGFRVRNNAQTVGLKVTLELDSDNTPPGGQTTFDLATGEAQGAILFGENIFYQLCDDVIEPDEPEEKIDERWELVEGQITLTKAIPRDESGGGGVGPVSASGTGLVAEKPNGDLLELGSVELINSNWAFFGG